MKCENRGLGGRETACESLERERAIRFAASRFNITDLDPAFLLLCEGEDSNLHGSYPTSTSRGSAVENRRVAEVEERRSTPIDPSERIPGGRVPQAEAAPDDLASEARALLRLAALREEVPAERARA